MNLRVLIAVALLLTYVLAPAARAGALTTEVVGTFPRDTSELAYVDLLVARNLIWFSDLQKHVLPDQLRQFEQFLASPGMASSSQVEAVAWAEIGDGSRTQSSQNSGVPAKEETVIVALGQFSPDSTEAYFRAQKRPVVKVRDYSLYRLSGGSGDGGLFFCFMNSNAAALGGRKELERVIAVRYNEEQSLLSNTELAPLISQANGRSAIWAVLSAPPAWAAMEQIVPFVAEFQQSQELFPTLRALTLSVDAGSRIQSRFEAVCASPHDANTFAALLQAALLYESSLGGKSNQDMTALLNQAKVAASGDRLDVTLAPTDNQVVGLLQRSSFPTHQ
jgi:hypothetical protein